MSSGEQSSKPDLYLVARIIRVLKEDGRMKKTALATSTGLAYDKLAKYLVWMVERGLVSIDDEGFVSLTGAGAQAYDELVKWILKHVGQLRFPRIRLRT